MIVPIATRVLPGGRILELWRFTHNYRLTLSEPQCHGFAVEDQWCYKDEAVGRSALDEWDGVGEPVGWVKHPATGRRGEGYGT